MADALLSVITGCGAAIGSLMEEPADPYPNEPFYFGTGLMEGLAAGGLLVMIANTMYAVLCPWYTGGPCGHLTWV